MRNLNKVVKYAHLNIYLRYKEIYMVFLGMFSLSGLSMDGRDILKLLTWILI